LRINSEPQRKKFKQGVGWARDKPPPPVPPQVEKGHFLRVGHACCVNSGALRQTKVNATANAVILFPGNFDADITGLNQQDAKLPANKRVGKPRDSKKVSEGCLPKQSGVGPVPRNKGENDENRTRRQSIRFVCFRMLYEGVLLLEGQMLPRCPRCSSLTVWELEEQETGDRNEKQLTRIA
jgi:hypothetical protein